MLTYTNIHGHKLTITGELSTAGYIYDSERSRVLQVIDGRVTAFCNSENCDQLVGVVNA